MGRSLVPLLALALALGNVAAAEMPQLVGPHSDFSQVQFRGVTQFDPDDIRTALKGSLALLLARQPDKLLTTLLFELERELTFSFQSLGCCDAQVRAGWNDADGCIVVDVNEGPRYRWRDLIIQGVSEEIEKSIREWLSDNPPIKEDSPIPLAVDATLAPKWKSRNYARQTKEYQQQVRQFVQHALALHAWEDSRFEIRVVLDLPTGSANLLVDVLDLGRSSSFDDIRVIGSDRQPKEDIIEVVHLVPGEPCSAAAIEAARLRLFGSPVDFGHPT